MRKARLRHIRDRFKDAQYIFITSHHGVMRVSTGPNGTTTYPNLFGRIALRAALTLALLLLLSASAIPVLLAIVLGLFTTLIAMGLFLLLVVPLLIFAALICL